MLRVADVLVISAALTTATEGLIGARELGLMKENATLINVARGEIIDEGALYAHLVAHPHFLAGIDAWWVEPVRHGRFAMGHPFLDLPNVIGSPHNSAGGGAWRDEYLRRAVQNCRRAVLGETPWNLIGPDERMLMVRRRANPGDVERLLLDTAAQDGKRVRIGFGKDPGQAGKSQAQHLVRALSGFTVDPASESGDKRTRFGPFSSQCRAGNVKIRRGSWNEELFRVLEGFPDLAHDDEVDACSGALEMLNPPMQSWGAYEFARQRAEEIRAAQQRKPQPAPPNPAPGSMEWQALQNSRDRSS